MTEDTPARTARRLMRQAVRASLGSRLAGEPWPYVSLVLVAWDQDMTALLLLSDLAQHTRNLMADPHASILFDGTAHLADPLTGPRITVLGRAEPVEDARALERFVRRQPSAAFYRGFRDFRLWRFAPARGQLVAGFGKIEWIEADALRPDPAISAALTQAEPGILRQLNAEQARLIETVGAKASGLVDWRLSGVDPDGADLRADHQVARLDFAQPAADAPGVLAQLQRLADA